MQSRRNHKPQVVKIKTITFIGAGNVAWHLATALHHKGFSILEIWNRTPDAARELAEQVRSRAALSLTSLLPADLYIMAVTDSALPEISAGINFHDRLVVHTAGSVPMNILSGVSEYHGVLYPLQTFSKNTPLQLKEVPFCVEASDEVSLDALVNLAGALSQKVLKTGSNDRLLLHVAAVFASNYTNLMYTLAKDILDSNNLSFELLKPLITETARKAVAASPELVQTGPAKRNDQPVIEKHLEILGSMPEYAEIYRLLARRIGERFG